MKRRALLAGVLGASTVPTVAIALGGLAGPPAPPSVKRAWVAHPQRIAQNCASWCWAASIAMIFASRGHPVDQASIVSRVFGGGICASAQPLQIAQALSSQWVDGYGRPFRSRVTAAYDAWNRVLAINNAIMVQELLRDRPMLYCNTHHAMVLVSVDYLDGPVGPMPIPGAAGVLDPWPAALPFHTLSVPEMTPSHLGGQMTMLAAVDLF